MSDLSWVAFLFAQAAPAGGGGAAPAGGGGGLDSMGMFVPMIAMLALVWFLMIRPAQKQERERKKKIYSLKRGDEVVFAGGIMGTVVNIKEKTGGTAADADEVTVRTDGNNRLRVLRSSIYQITPATSETTEPSEKSA